MDYDIKKKIFIKATLDCSEAVMFNQGGMHKINFPFDKIEGDFDEIEFSIQLSKKDQYRHDWILSEAEKAKVRREDENKQT